MISQAGMYACLLPLEPGIWKGLLSCIYCALLEMCGVIGGRLGMYFWGMGKAGMDVDERGGEVGR